MKLILLEDAGKAIQNIDARLKAGKPVSEKDFAELTADEIAPYLDPDSRAPKPTGTNETVIIEQYLRKLVGADFALCNQCYLVNLNFVESINKNTVKVKDEELRISVPRRKEFENTFLEFFI